MKSNKAHFLLGPPSVILTPTEPWEQGSIHSFQWIERDKERYRYWGYYGCFHFEGVGLSRSDDLRGRWVKYAGNPILKNARWPSPILENSTVHLFVETHPLSSSIEGDSNIFIRHYKSQDGISFQVEDDPVPFSPGNTYRNPFIWRNPNDNRYHLYYLAREPSSSPLRRIMVKVASNINDLASASPQIVVSKANCAFGSPSVVLVNGLYWLTCEHKLPRRRIVSRFLKPKWRELAFYSRYADKGFVEAAHADISNLKDVACGFQYLVDKRLYFYYSKRAVGNRWDIRLRISKSRFS